MNLHAKTRQSALEHIQKLDSSVLPALSPQQQKLHSDITALMLTKPQSTDHSRRKLTAKT